MERWEVKYLCKLNLSTHDKSHSWPAWVVSSNTGSEEFCYNQEILNIFTYPHIWKINNTYNHWLILFIALFIAAVNAKVMINILWTLKTIKRFSFVSIRDFLARLHFRYINNLFPDTDMDALMLFASWAMVMMHLEAGEASWKLDSRGDPGVWADTAFIRDVTASWIRHGICHD